MKSIIAMVTALVFAASPAVAVAFTDDGPFAFPVVNFVYRF
jgi:hypothetical protein